jgi:hypothetical protein
MTENTRPEGLNGENSQNTPKKGEATMSSEEKERKRISRREFVRGAAVGAAGVAAAGALASCATATPEVITKEVVVEREVPVTVEVEKQVIVEKEVVKTVEVEKEVEVKPWLPEKWDYEADVVVVGFGAAGSAAAIEAHDAGVEVILLEKMPEGLEGGDTAVCGGLAGNFSSDIAIAREKTFGNVNEELLQKNIEACNELTSWQESMGIEFTWFVPGTVGYIADNGKGVAWFAALKAQVNKRGIKVLYETPGKGLIQDPMTGKILGVKVYARQHRRWSQDGSESGSAPMAHGDGP